MKMKFFARTYLLTLLLFLVFLNGCVLTLAAYNYENRIEATNQVCLAEHSTIRRSFENDYDGVKSGSDYILQTTYGSFYLQKGIYLCFADAAGAVSYSSLPQGLLPPSVGTMDDAVAADGTRYFLICESICDGEFQLTYAKSIHELDEEFRQLFFVFLSVSLAASSLLAVLLYVILHRLYAPLNKLRSVTAQLSHGEFSVRADERGNDEFAALGAEFNRMADQITAQMTQLQHTADQKQQMLDNLAHEMRTPLMSIHGYAEYIQTANIPEEERLDALQHIMGESMRLRSISEVLLDMAYLREHPITRTPLSARSLLSHTKERFALRAAQKNVALILHEQTGVVWGDELLLELLLSNLTENALNACSDGGAVELGVADENGETVLYIKDNGIGMSPEQLQHITEPFYRTDKARSRRIGGTGLGLALCARIAQVHRAALEFSSSPGQGTQAQLRFGKEEQE